MLERYKCQDGTNPKANFSPANIPLAVSAFRPDGQVPVLNQQHFDGGQCRIFKVEFSDAESWAVRIPLHGQTDSEDAIINLLRDEQVVLQEIGKTTFAWAPKIRGSSFKFDNPVGFPFLALSWIEGSPLTWTADYPPRPVRDKVLAQIAEIQRSLIECTQDSNRSPATKHFSRIIDNKITRVRNGQLPEITEQDCLDQRNLLSLVLHPELENAPFAIDHGDLAPLNIMVDSDYNITGVVDWGFASMVPFQLAGRMPRFLQLFELRLPPDVTLQEDRKTYITSLESQSSTSQVAFWISLIHSPDDVDFRHCYLESLISKGMHSTLARLGWKLPNRERSKVPYRGSFLV